MLSFIPQKEKKEPPVYANTATKGEQKLHQDLQDKSILFHMY